MTTGPAPKISPELRKLIQEWCKEQQQKYGPDWKKILAKEMSAKTIDAMRTAGVIKNVK